LIICTTDLAAYTSAIKYLPPAVFPNIDFSGCFAFNQR